ncbi:META domain-containing protein [Antarctobacter heliothermus]|uniref:Type III secretion system lipoprotein chaperone (YscW) n=1 Tax=Antarctobacter heliothermus TaxID=74033 RepID=A0A239M347_9RHOB|nr:META domain-containing protein [Antarctobacter heliothermus]SNT37116.1 Type III secretion system lipoprotein chaperone (YscW) [Antarctobacter heliothermus]
MQPKMFLAIAATLAPFCAFGGELSGTASYRERIALPSEATFQAVLYDISDNDQVEIGRFETTGDEGPPYHFTIDYADEDVTQDGLYAITTQVIWPDRPYFIAGTNLDGFPTAMPEIDLVMVRPGVSPAVTPLETTELLSPMIGAHGLALPATYQGVVDGNAGAEAWSLALATDQTFQLSRTFESSERDSLGRWVADPTAGTLVLRDGAEMPLLVRSIASGALRVVDANTGEEFAGDLTLAKDKVLELSGMMMGGMMTYMADAAIFEDCVSGAIFPVAQEGDYLALEQAYLADRAEPGAPLYVMLDGGLAMRPAIEGPDRQMVIVDQFIRTRPEIACAQQRADAALLNTYWRLDTLDGETFPMQATQREPHMVLEASESGAYRAMIGCNRMRGAYTLDGGALTFSPAAATMMACPEPLDALEHRFGEVMADVTGYAIEAETLVLRNADGDHLAIFTAVYF